MLGWIKQLRQRTPLGFFQLRHDPTRLLTAIAGITFADVLIFMQLGFSDALYRSNTAYPRALDTDLVIVSTQAKNFGQLQTFTRRRLYQAIDVPGVAEVDAMYVGLLDWRDPETSQEIRLQVVGQNPERPAFSLPEVNDQLDAATLPDAVLFDRGSRGEFQATIARVAAGKPTTTEVGTRTVTVAGLFEVGASFASDGAAITSDQNFLRLFPKRAAGSASLGLIRLQQGAEPESVRDAVATHLPADVRVMTHEEYVAFELRDIQERSPIGFVFGLGTAMGFIVGTVIVYQVLSTDVNSHMSEYATFKAMGFRNTYLLGVIFEEALILSFLGFVPGLGIAVAAYRFAAAATALPIVMPLGRVVFVLLLTLAMCNVSGAIATRRLQAADPADIF